MKSRVYSMIAIFCFMLLLTGCWVPEKFDSNVKINKDGSYTFTYNGTLTYARALAAANKGSLSKRDELKLKKGVEKLRREPGFKNVKYLGDGRYKVSVEKRSKAGEAYYFPSKKIKIFSINPQEDGSIKITFIQLNKKELNRLRSIGAKVNGTFTVSVEKGVEVIKHNAQSKPKLFGLFGNYKWDIKSFDAEQPYIVVKPSSSPINRVQRSSIE